MTWFYETHQLTQALLLSLFAGAAIPLGAACAQLEIFLPNWHKNEFRHFIMALGGGILLAAISLVLIPEGTKDLPHHWSISIFLMGGFCFYLIDRQIAKRPGHYGQLMAMLTDFIPEAMALGAMIASNSKSSILLALMIALQNIPEGFNAYREAAQSHRRKNMILNIGFILISALGPLCALIGFSFLSDQASIVAGIMVFASGGILYLVFQDIAPQAHMKQKWLPTLGSVFGFSIGLAGHLYL